MFDRRPLSLRQLTAWAVALSMLGNLLGGRPVTGQQAGPIRAGAHAIDITPPMLPISVNGNMQDIKTATVHDRLHARCLVLDDGTTRLAIVVCDSCMIPRALLDDAKRQARQATGIPEDRMLISATHTHTAPAVAGVFQSDPDAAYQRYLADRIAKGIQRAAANLAPAKVGWAVGRDPTQVFNRRWKLRPGTVPADPFGRTTDAVKMNPGNLNPNLVAPAGPTDPDVSVLSVQAPDGRPVALLANYGLHYVGGVPPLSADYYGAFADRIGQLVGTGPGDPPFVGIMSNGTSGDTNNNDVTVAHVRREPYEQIKLVANSVARAAHEAYRRVEHRDRVALAMAEREIELGVRRPTAEDVAKARALLEKAEQGRPLKTLPEIYARETVLMADYPATVHLKLQAVRIGDLGIVAIPCETFTETGLDLKARSPLKPTFAIELANGYNGYLPPPDQHRLGGYETWRARSSYLEVEAAPKITAALLDLLRAVAQ